MEKPIPEDYGLTEASLTSFDRQVARRESLREIEVKKNKTVRNCVLVLCTILAIALFILLLTIDSFIIPGLIVEGLTVAVAVFFIFRDPEHLTRMAVLRINSAVDPKLRRRIEEYQSAKQTYQIYWERSQRSFWENLTGFEFEKEVASLFRSLDYDTYVTKKTGDGGVDIVLTKGFERIAIQCKHHKSKVGPNDVRALQGVVHNGNYTSGIFVSLNGFTPMVYREIALGKDEILLYDLGDLIQLQRKAFAPSEKAYESLEHADTAINEDKKTDIDPSFFIGKTIRRVDGDFEGLVKDVDERYIYVIITKGERTGQETKLSFPFFLKNSNLYSFSENQE